MLIYLTTMLNVLTELDGVFSIKEDEAKNITVGFLVDDTFLGLDLGKV